MKPSTGLGLLHLPKDVLSNIATHLDIASFSFSETCRYMHEICSTDSLWKSLVTTHFVDQDHPNSENSWKLYYIKCYQNYCFEKSRMMLFKSKDLQIDKSLVPSTTPELKIVVLGHAGVGKSALVMNYVQGDIPVYEIRSNICSYMCKRLISTSELV